MRVINFRTWNSSTKRWVYPVLDISNPFSYAGCEFLQFSGIQDKKGIWIWEGDIRVINGKRYKVVCDGWRFRFERNLVEFGENESIVLDEDNAYESVLIGNVCENPDLKIS
jgi:hypothetical protein